MASPKHDLVRIAEVARELGLSPTRIRQLADAGVIPSSRTQGGHRLFDLDEVRAAVTRRALSAEEQAPPEVPTWQRTLTLLGLAEHEVWARIVADLGLDTASNAGRIFAYAFMEMLNNAIDHSGSETATIKWWTSPDQWSFEITDEGVDPQTDRVLVDVFKQFTRDHAFVRTRPVVKLFEIGTTFVSRSEARRLLDGLDTDFGVVEVDFAGVEDVGQGFVDELLRVWPATHPGKSVVPMNMNPAVEFMVRRGIHRATEDR